MDRLKINHEKTEFLLVGTRQALAKFCVEPLAVGDHLIAPCHVAKNLGYWIDQQLSMVTNIREFKKLLHYLSIMYRVLIISHQCFLNFIGCLCIIELYSKS